ncbi:MAG: hypothetical protein AB7T20_05980 [Steroidobacteraceae bacterium]
MSVRVVATAGTAWLLAGCGQPAGAPAEPADPPGPALLFAAGHGDLNAAERGQVFGATGLAVAPDGKSFVDGICGEPASASVEFRDMNADGRQEVLVIFGNSCTSGHTGSSAALFIRDPNGSLQANLGFPAASADPLPEKNQGYPDLLIGGPGFCFGVWRWNGSAYDHLRNDPQMPGGCDHLNE